MSPLPRVPIPLNELERLQVLRRYRILDTEEDPIFDELTTLAAQICEAPIALLTLVDEHRQWFKSKRGVPFRETPRELSFCAHAICQEGLFAVPDLARDERFRESPFVVDAPHVRFYAGAPLVTAEGLALGTLCVLDIVPRVLTRNQEAGLSALARQVVALLSARKHIVELEEKWVEREWLLEERRRDIEYLGTLVDGMTDMVFLKDLKGRCLVANPAAAAFVGRTQSELLGSEVAALFPEPVRVEIYEAERAVLDSGRPQTAEHTIPSPDGAARTFLVTRGPVKGAGGEFSAIFSIWRDVTKRHRATEELKRFFTLSLDLVCVVDFEGRFRDLNKRWEAVLGYSREELKAHPFVDFVHPDDRPATQAQIERLVSTGQELHAFENRFRCHDGSYRWLLWSSAVSRDNRVFYAVARDITDRKKTEKLLLDRASLDPLTGLSNRIRFRTSLGRCFRRTQAQEAYRLAVLYIDVDNFKDINDRFGHLVGDELLVAVARRLETCVRPGDLVGRLGGDEFGILLDDVDPETAAAVSERIGSVLGAPLPALPDAKITTSIGVALSEPRHQTAEDVLRDADEALLEAKRRGKARAVVYGTMTRATDISPDRCS